jgi:O-antigen/teichoic acid export membrane protein
MKSVRSIFSLLLSDDLLRHTGVLFSGMLVVHVCNMVFQMAVSRALPKQEYALLAAFLAVLAIIQRPLSTLTTGVSHYASLLQQDGRRGDVSRLLRKWLLLCGSVGLLLGGVAVGFNKPLAGFLHLERSAPVIIGGMILPVLFCLPVLGGAGQGLQLFGWCSASTIFGALIRLGLGAGFVWFLVPACGWAMLGHGLGIYAAAALLLLGLFLVLHGSKKSDETLPSMRLYLFQSFFIQAAYAVLMTADVVLVKHYFPEDTEFAYAATLSRMVVFLPGAIVAAMFPKVASRGAGTVEQDKIFMKSMLWTGLFVAVAVTGCFRFSGLLARILFGITDTSVYLKQMIGWMALVMAFSALLNVVVQFLLAQRRFKGASSVIVFSAAYLVVAWIAHGSVLQIVGAGAAGNMGALICLMLYLGRMRCRV